MRTPAMHNDQMAAVQRVAAQRRFMQRLISELLVFVALIVPICIFEFVIEPATRGFFCDDETIRYPFHNNTVTPVHLGLLIGTLPWLIFIIVEYVRAKRRGEICIEAGAKMPFFEWSVPKWCYAIVRQLMYFLYGLLITLNATEVGKYTIGRLRPHFIAVCQPQLTDGSSCTDTQNLHRYIEHYNCAAEGFTIADVRQARLSFPSGHSSLAFYAMVYVALYLQRKVSWRGSELTRHVVQFTLIMLAWFTALSRVMDNWHHWSDVVIGSLIGIVCALITAQCIAKFFEPSYTAAGLRLSSVSADNHGGLQRQDTSATLQEVCTSSSTPPPYIDDEQYTKV